MATGREASFRILHLRIPVVREGLIFVFPLLGISVLLWILEISAWAWFFSLLTAFVISFFRDPERTIPAGDKAILSPADGKIIRLESCTEERFLKGPAIKVSIFMSVFNVHVNRIPLSGRIAEVAYRPGKFVSANLDKASAANEQNALLLEAAGGTKLLFVQIAGLIARRIVCWVRKGDPVERGRRFGLIRFGSRMDVYLPPNVQIQARLGQKAYGGQTILGYLP
ncbi:MAG: phosphatidylserine decarboxylase family protein [Deltaproteobacteria bacterium]|nr:phosphatidylserine decarboxylase family protein [Deltaproteobacteria bacterium]